MRVGLQDCGQAGQAGPASAGAAAGRGAAPGSTARRPGAPPADALATPLRSLSALVGQRDHQQGHAAEQRLEAALTPAPPTRATRSAPRASAERTPQARGKPASSAQRQDHPGRERRLSDKWLSGLSDKRFAAPSPLVRQVVRLVRQAGAPRPAPARNLPLPRPRPPSRRAGAHCGGQAEERHDHSASRGSAPRASPAGPARARRRRTIPCQVQPIPRGAKAASSGPRRRAPGVRRPRPAEQQDAAAQIRFLLDVGEVGAGHNSSRARRGRRGRR